jgi:thymidylate kinase
VQQSDAGNATAPVGRAWLSSLFELLEQRQVNYVALRVDESVLRSGGELDLLVHPGSFALLLDGLRALCVQQRDLRVVFWRVRPRLAATIVLTHPRPDGSTDHCWLDIRTGLHKAGRILYDGTELRPSETLWDEELGLRRLDDDRECALLLLRNASDGRLPNARHERILRRGGAAALPQVVRDLGFDPDALEAGRVAPAGRSRRSRQVRYYLRSAVGRLRAESSGINVVLYGPDGVGKSSQAELLAAFCRSSGVRRTGVRTYHAFVPTESLTTHAARRSTSLKTGAYRRARLPASRAVLLIVSYLKRLALVTFRLRPQLRRGTIMIHDRYLLDVFLKAQKEHGERIPPVERVLSALTPSRDLLFVLRASPAAVSARTGELSPAEVRAAYVLLDSCLAVSRSPSIDIDADRSPEQVQAALVDRLLRAQTDRFVSSR